MSFCFLSACILVHLSNSFHKLLNIICVQSTSSPTSWPLLPLDPQHTYFDKLIMNQLLSICQWHTLYLSSQNKFQTPSQKYSRIILNCYGLVPSNQCPTMWLNLLYIGFFSLSHLFPHFYYFHLFGITLLGWSKN